MSDDNAPLKLKHAAEEYGFSVWELRAEVKRGNLAIYRIGRTHYTTPNDIRDMIEKCRVAQKGHGFTLTRRENNGSSETDRALSAQAAANEAALRLRNSSRNTLGASTSRNRQVRQ